MDESESEDSDPSVIDATVVPQPSFVEQVVHTKFGVLLACFGVLAILGLPLIWVSRAFTRKEKFFWSIVVTLYTLALCAMTGYALWFLWQQLSAMQS